MFLSYVLCGLYDDDNESWILQIVQKIRSQIYLLSIMQIIVICMVFKRLMCEGQINFSDEKEA